MDTIEYYNKYASRIFEDTVDRDMESQREEFLEELREIDGDTILDLGCGSGRDSLAFYEQGFDVTPLDASEEMCKLAQDWRCCAWTMRIWSLTMRLTASGATKH